MCCWSSSDALLVQGYDSGLSALFRSRGSPDHFQCRLPGIVVPVPRQCRYAPVQNAGTIAATGIILHTVTRGVIPSAPNDFTCILAAIGIIYQVTGIVEEPLRHLLVYPRVIMREMPW